MQKINYYSSDWIHDSGVLSRESYNTIYYDSLVLSNAPSTVHYRMSHDRWHAFNQSEVLNAVQYSVVFPFTGVRCTQRASIGYWPGPISNTGPLSTPYTRKGKQLPQARFTELVLSLRKTLR